jgi:4-hydroxy-tetrahydrodipicolinate synthase
MSTFHGVIVALAMPMTDAGESIDEPALLDHIDWLIDAGVHGILVLSGTGEYAYLRPEEKRRVVELCLPHIDGRVPTMVQTSEMSLTDTIDSSKHAIDFGAEAVMVLPPWLESPFERGVMYHYERVAQAVPTDIVLYNTPAASGVEITPSMYRKLLAIDNIAYMKDSQGDLSRIQKLVSISEGTNANVLCGVDPLAPYALQAGAVGMIWGTANIMPHECVELVELIDAGQHAKALELWKLMWPTQAFMWENELDVGFLPGVKAATEMVGRKMGPVRRPQMPVTGSARLAIEACLSTLPYNGIDRTRLKFREWSDEQDWLVRSTERRQGGTDR